MNEITTKKANPILLGVLGVFVSNISHASALEQSGQSILPFLENGNYAEANLFAVDASVSGIVNDRADLVRDHQSRDTGDIAESTQFYTAAIKLQLTDRLGFGVLYDQPFSADIKYPARSNNSYFDNDISHEGTSVKADTQNLSLLFGYSPYQHFQIYGGPVYQTVKANVALRGNAYTQAFNGYNAKFKQQGEVGWLLGGSYQLPDIALKAAITYRSKIKYQFQVEEDIFGEPLKLVENEKNQLETPASLNIDFQTGISEKSLVYMNLRWVNWKEFETRPPQYGALSEILMKELTNGEYIQGFKLDSYQNDQYSATLGIAHQFTEKWSTSTDVSWDSGTGNPASTMGPIKGSWSLGLGVQFNPAKNYFITGSLKYFWLGDTKTEDGTYYLPIEGIKPYAEQANFKNNHAIAYGFKFGYWF
ncbi:outer membrane protein transport protein [Acinetobacter baumannii]|uniref:Outer membrane transport family protein n=1 Tax=Acinetobacter baumannii (strain 1295743) TaxID=1310613 RepID=A0A009IJ29_ACIB9|nr:outer membrane protein transport protein [Acinetobacter baumannii]EXB03808.1 outer membrane transport family protein [Acinetobacter baumannii 1295743]MDC4520019.1 outer membrane protein transport protein [Acinetobacter baumannii]MDC4577989.1 outer membrane protein transport protein [Acinetobacter baumannii]MDC4581261.1 outer membrane protein transport protein [Acinetobacter baumannii]MDC4588464.1 outer membrane protein transport protein [Acinetobacter baumannii]